MENAPVPSRLKKFPFHGPYLVHYTVFVGDDGVPNFKVIHEENRQHAMKNYLCHLCGQLLELPMVFIGGERSAEARIFMDGPMHEECAKYAVQVCPYLINPLHGHSKAEPKHAGQEGLNIQTIEAIAEGRPPVMVLYYTTGYRRAKLGESIVFYADGPTMIDRDLIPKREENG